jgi:hypothetical protein
MMVALAATWDPRGELPRLLRLFPQMEQVYERLAIVVEPETGPDLVEAVRALGSRVEPVVASNWSAGRHLALQQALETGAESIHYADLDRLLHWVETRPDEWRDTVERLRLADCVIHGRTEAAYRTHPQALARTEAISNLVASHLLGRPVDVSAGSRGFSRRAAEFLVANSPPGSALGTDAGWPVLLQRAGFAIEYAAVDGLDWEIPDQYQAEAASAERQARLARAYDADPHNWARRVEVALEIVRSGYLSTKDTKMELK